MAKQQRKQQIVRNRQGQGHLIEEVFDDNLLPDASEIERLYQIDKGILDWLKKSAETEQQFRHNAYYEKVKIAKKAELGIRVISILGITFSFIIVLAGMGLSVYLIQAGHTTLGGVFAGGIVLSIVVAFLKKVSSVGTTE